MSRTPLRTITLPIRALGSGPFVKLDFSPVDNKKPRKKSRRLGAFFDFHFDTFEFKNEIFNTIIQILNL